MTLFPLEPIPDPEPISADRRRTLTQRRLLDAGVHPATRQPLRDSETCHTCLHLRSHSRTKTYYKCGLVELTLGAGTDIRLSWPACIQWEPSHR